MSNKFLVWVSTNHGKTAAELYGSHRRYDIAIHDYGTWASDARDKRADYWIPSEGTEKLETAGANISSLPRYDFYAFLDDDLEVSTTKLNELFYEGRRFGLQIYQPALSGDSCASWPHTVVQNPWVGAVRQVPFVEVMCPFFSCGALKRCLWSFGLNQSGWGLDCCIWPKLATTHVCDGYTVRHPGPFRDAALRTMRNGLTAWQEYDIIKKINYDGDETRW